MTEQEAIALIDQLEFVFDIVRLVDAAMTHRLSTDSNGEFVTEPYHCYTVWNKDSRCDNCISAKVFSSSPVKTSYPNLNL